MDQAVAANPRPIQTIMIGSSATAIAPNRMGPAMPTGAAGALILRWDIDHNPGKSTRSVNDRPGALGRNIVATYCR